MLWREAPPAALFADAAAQHDALKNRPRLPTDLGGCPPRAQALALLLAALLPPPSFLNRPVSRKVVDANLMDSKVSSFKVLTVFEKSVSAVKVLNDVVAELE